MGADALTLGLMVWASTLKPSLEGDMRTIDNIYVGCVLIQVRMGAESSTSGEGCVPRFVLDR